MSDYTETPLPEPRPARLGLQKTFRTHDGRRGNRAAIKAYTDGHGMAYVSEMSGVFNPDDPMGASQVRMMMRELGWRMRDWANANGAQIGTDGKDFLGGECS